jgi:hypothetical protein
MAVRVTLAGRVGIEGTGTGVDEAALGRPARVALAYLICERDRPVTRDELAEVVWGEELPRSWEQLVRGLAVKIRAALATAGLDPATTLSVAFGAYVVVDVEEAAAVLGEADAALSTPTGRPPLSSRPLRKCSHSREAHARIRALTFCAAVDTQRERLTAVIP